MTRIGNFHEPSPRESQIAHDLAELARSLSAAPDPTTVLRQVVAAAVIEIPGVELAGVTILSRDGVSTPAFTDELVRLVDTAQYRTGEGPCLAAAADQRVVRADDLHQEPRWPRFAARATSLGVGSMLSFQLFTSAGSMGALNVYARCPRAFPAYAEDVGMPLATHAAVALTSTRTETELRAALDTRDVIGQAKGILMERYQIDAEQAFNLLLVASQRTNRKLRDIAAELTTTGQLTPHV